MNKKQEKQHQFAKNILVKRLNESIQKREVEINTLKGYFQKSRIASQKFQKSSIALDNMLSQQRKSGDTRGLGYISKPIESKPECSLNQEVQSISRTINNLKVSLAQIHEPLNEAQRQLVLR